jgi:hypothetical protein
MAITTWLDALRKPCQSQGPHRQNRFHSTPQNLA